LFPNSMTRTHLTESLSVPPCALIIIKPASPYDPLCTIRKAPTFNYLRHRVIKYNAQQDHPTCKMTPSQPIP
jgi:hypothetical protein